MTGRRMGNCAGNDHPGFAYHQSPRGRGFGGGGRFRGGWGPGNRHGYGVPCYHGSADVPEKTMIENEIRILKDQLQSLEERLVKIREDNGKR
jgi:hypothetical protein